MNKLVFEVNNGRKLELVQREDNGTTLICSLDAPDNEAYISAGDFVQLITFTATASGTISKTIGLTPTAKIRRYNKMTRSDELNAEIRNQAVRLYPKCAALFELPLMVYTQIVADNLTRSKPYRLSVERCKKIILAMPEFD